MGNPPIESSECPQSEPTVPREKAGALAGATLSRYENYRCRIASAEMLPGQGRCRASGTPLGRGIFGQDSRLPESGRSRLAAWGHERKSPSSLLIAMHSDGCIELH